MSDFSLASPIKIFRNLGRLDVDVFCYDEDGETRCTFMLYNDNIAELAMALPQLRYLTLGHPCSENACPTTVASLLLISVHCVKLEHLEIHFNTANILENLNNISEDPKFRELHSLPRCPLSYLGVFAMPLTLDEESEYKTMADGIIDIFPSLEHCEGFIGEGWSEVSKNLRHADALMGFQ